MKKKIKDILWTALAGFAVGLVCAGVIALNGCIKWKVPVSGGKYIVHERWWSKASADKVDFYYKDPNVTVLISVNDPNVSVNDGKLRIIEPRTGLAAELTAGN